MKKRVGIIYSGQTRSNSLNPNYNNDNIILDATSKFFLNNEFKDRYNYDVFFSVDIINVSKAKEYFGENLKNIHITETNWYMHPIEEIIPEFNYFHNKFLQIDFQNLPNHEHGFYQYYIMFCAYKLLKDYQQNNNIKYDYLVRIRPDIRLMQDIIPLFNILENTNKEIILEHDFQFILKYDLEELFNFVNFYGHYKNPVEPQNINIFKHFVHENHLNSFVSDGSTRFAPERQFGEYLNEVILKKNKKYEEVVVGITYPSYNLLYRGNGLYGYVEYKEEPEWIPFHNLEYIYNNYKINFNLIYTDNIIGIIPLGGNATRMKNIPKYLLPCKINYSLLDNTIEIFHKNNIYNLLAGVSETNNYLLQKDDKLNKIVVNTKTMAETFDKIINKIINKIMDDKVKAYLLIMPDTYFKINNEIIDMIHKLNTYDIVVLVWKIKDCQIGKLGQCKIENDEIIDIIDKDKNCNYKYFWGCIAWNKSMNKYINPQWETIGDLIKTSITLNIKVGSIICNSDYYDCGTYEEYFKMIKNEI